MFNDNKRFETVYKQISINKSIRIIKDKETGVCYLFTKSGYGGGLTVLLDSNGKPVKN